MNSLLAYVKYMLIEKKVNSKVWKKLCGNSCACPFVDSFLSLKYFSQSIPS